MAVQSGAIAHWWEVAYAVSVCITLAALLLAIPLCCQNVNPNYPVELETQKHSSPEEIRQRLSNAQFQKDTKELAEVCASIPNDMDGLRQGLLPKDLVEKLKRVERLSKRVREQLTRNATAP
jgi:hypothetical protein